MGSFMLARMSIAARGPGALDSSANNAYFSSPTGNNTSRISAEGSMKVPNPQDPRAVKTRLALRAALVSLIIERGWDAVAIRDVCQRAGVGRSTFYTHFADREELLDGKTSPARCNPVRCRDRSVVHPGGATTEEGAAGRDYSSMQGHTVTDGCHGELANTRLQECTAEITLFKGSGIFQESVCLV